jgi:hypothetical protein
MSRRPDQLGVRRGTSWADSAHHSWALPPLRSRLHRGMGKEPRAGTEVMSWGTAAWCPTRSLTAAMQGFREFSTKRSTDARLSRSCYSRAGA